MQVRERFFFTSTAPATQRVEEAGVIDVGKRLDEQAAQRMRQHLKRLAAQGHQRHIVDLTDLVVLDSGGLAGLISALRAVRETGGTVELVASADHVTQILELTALTRVFKVHRSVEAALASG